MFRHRHPGPRPAAARLLAWAEAWDEAVRGLLAERPAALPLEPSPFSAAGIALAAVMFVAMLAVVAKVGPHPFLLVMFVAFASLYFALVPARLLLRPLGVGVPKIDAAELLQAATQSQRAWEETASRAVAAWHLARESALRRLDELAPRDPEAAEAAGRIRAWNAPAAPLPDVDVGTLGLSASSPLGNIPSLEGWGAVTNAVVYLARRKPFTFSEVLVVLFGVAAVPPAVFLAIDGAASVTVCAVLPEACAQRDPGLSFFLVGMIALTGLVILWRVVTRARLDCPACSTSVAVPRLAPHGRCPGCRRRVWVQWRR